MEKAKQNFFKAIDWLLNGDNKKLELLVSAKTLSETNESKRCRVSVSLKVEQYGETKVLTKSFLVKKLGEGECSFSYYKLEGPEKQVRKKEVKLMAMLY